MLHFSVSRRHALSGAAALATSPLLLQGAQAQGFVPQEGRHFRRLPKALPASPGKVEVIEFFWYGCPHCYELEAPLAAWLKTLPAYVSFRHVHVFFRESMRAHQRLFFTLEALGVESQMRGAVFAAMHQQGNPLETPEAAVKLLTPLGLDAAKFMSAYNSFGVNARMQAGTQLQSAYNVDGVPLLGIGGQYITSPEMARGGERLPSGVTSQRALAMASQLLARIKA